MLSFAEGRLRPDGIARCLLDGQPSMGTTQADIEKGARTLEGQRHSGTPCHAVHPQVRVAAMVCLLEQEQAAFTENHGSFLPSD